jgi:predicted nucleotidyltransferase
MPLDMHRYESHTKLNDVWTNDNVFDGTYISRLTEPLKVTSDEGVNLLLSTLCYFTDPQGDRLQAQLDRKFTKRVRDYGKVELFRSEPDVQPYLLIDERAQLTLVATELDKVVRTFDARQAWLEVVNEDSPLGEALSRFSACFPSTEFGLLGSRAVGLQKSDSDVDVFIRGADFSMVTELLRIPEIQRYLKIDPIGDDEQTAFGVKYAKRFHVSFEEGKRLALLRSRYTLQTEAGPMDLSFSGSFSKSDYQEETALGSTRMSKGVVEGRMINVENGASFPRVHVAEIDGTPTQIISMKWELQCLARPDDHVQIRGILREKNGQQLISLEDEDDIVQLVSS